MNIRNYGVVSMPYIGLPPFLPPEETPSPSETPEVCQCPISGFPHFYKVAIYIQQYKRKSVNALYRASPISTLSLQKPFKINGFRGRFQGVIVRKF